jgi:hypothetical protein
MNHHSRPLTNCTLVTLALLASLVGCGGSTYLPVSGVVSLDGTPVADAGVIFWPTESGSTATGTTDVAGRFRLATTNTPGALPGQYRVSITKKAFSGVSEFGIVDSKRIRVRWIVPQRYSKVETSGLKASVDRDQSEFNFALSSRQSGIPGTPGHSDSMKERSSCLCLGE